MSSSQIGTTSQSPENNSYYYMHFVSSYEDDMLPSFYSHDPTDFCDFTYSMNSVIQFATVYLDIVGRAEPNLSKKVAIICLKNTVIAKLRKHFISVLKYEEKNNWKLKNVTNFTKICHQTDLCRLVKQSILHLFIL